MQFLQSDASVKAEHERYALTQFSLKNSFLDFMQQERYVDCLILQSIPELTQMFHQLREQAVLLPAVVVESREVELSTDSPQGALTGMGSQWASCEFPYHAAVLQVSQTQLSGIDNWINAAIGKFLNLSPACQIPDFGLTTGSIAALTTRNSLIVQQQRLAEKLKERLGYLGVYYKRNAINFLRHMPQPEQQELLQQLKVDYREIILKYFSSGVKLNEQIDNFVNLAFFADVPVGQIVEIHMELMDEFSKQLKLEGRSDEMLLDYRLTLIDAIAHLCEMYRRSISKES